jgi:hypothetical protein
VVDVDGEILVHCETRGMLSPSEDFGEAQSRRNENLGVKSSNLYTGLPSLFRKWDTVELPFLNVFC